MEYGGASTPALVGKALAGLSTATVIATVSAIPWLLGGVVPEARLLLLGGAVTASAASLLANLAQRRAASGLPLVVFPLMGLALLGTCQLRQTDHHPASDMHHAQAGTASEIALRAAPRASMSPADTRSNVAFLIALALLATVAAERLRSPATVATAGIAIIANATIVTALGFARLFGHGTLWLNDRWTLGQNTRENAFGGFINPNNAAGWLLLAVAVSAGFITWYLARRSGRQGRTHLESSHGAQLWHRLLGFIANLTAWQICAFGALAFLTAGVAATKSRGGIAALIAATVATIALRNSMRRLPLVVLFVAVAGGASYGLLASLKLDRDIAAEMESLADLKDASADRVNHWLDATKVAWDFPWLGTGLGSYRFAYLPYASIDDGTWHRNADCHYVEMLVEGGAVGLVLFLVTGGCCLLTGAGGWTLSKTRRITNEDDAPTVSRRLLAGCGTTTVMATLSQTCAAATDFGIGLPAAASLLMLITATTAGICSTHESAPGLLRSGYARLGIGASLLVNLFMLTAGASYIPDQIAAARVDQHVVVAHRLLQEPTEARNLDQLRSAKDWLLMSLHKRPDDPEGLWALARVTDAHFRWWTLLDSMGSNVRDDPDVGRLFRSTTLFSLVRALHTLQLQEGDAEKHRMQLLLSTEMEKQQVERTVEAAQYRHPLQPQIAAIGAGLSLIKGDVDGFERQVKHAQIAHPADAAQLFNLGAMALRSGNHSLALSLWTQSLRASGEFRAAILTEGQHVWDNGYVLDHFGPTTYLGALQTASRLQVQALRAEIWQKAEELWATVPRPAPADVSVRRTQHLRAQQRLEEAMTWLAAASREHRDDVRLATMYAQQLEKAERYRDAVQEWHRVQYLDPDNAQAASAIERIRRLK